MLKKPVQEFYRNLFKFTGIGLGGLLNMAGKSVGQIAGKLLKELALGEDLPLYDFKKLLEVFLFKVALLELWRLSLVENGAVKK